MTSIRMNADERALFGDVVCSGEGNNILVLWSLMIGDLKYSEESK